MGILFRLIESVMSEKIIHLNPCDGLESKSPVSAGLFEVLKLL
jgi:hypothetical protein